MDSPHLSSSAGVFKQHSTYCMKCLELLDIINLWEVGVDGAARNFSRIRRELACVMSGLQQLEELYDTHSKNSPNEEEREVLAALKNSAEKAMEISHKAACACFQKTKPVDAIGDVFQNNRGYSFTESSTKPISRILNSSYSHSTGLCQLNDISAHAKRSVSPKRPFSMMATMHSSAEDLQSSSEDIVEDHVFTISEDHCKNEKVISRRTDYTEWTPDDPPEHKPERWHPKEYIPESYSTHLNSANEIRNRRSRLYNSHSVDQPKPPPTESERKRCKSHCEEKIDHTARQRSSVSPTFSDESDSDLQLERVMAKISSLEEERFKLMQTIEVLQSDNLSVRQSLRETLGTLEMKDVQLKLAMQDLGIATSEIKKASELNGKLRTLEREKNAYMERLSLLEDESSAVKLSLIQLLQDKAAVNKSLALENSQLQRQLTLKRSTRDGSKKSSEDEASSNHKEEPTDVGLLVHKQGFLIKRGGRVRTWKKRLFVLDSAGLSYFKTEQPIHNIPLNQILSATVSREVIPFVPHLFEIQTASRTYLCGASTHEDMQSWVGILQTLTQYCGKKDIVGVCHSKGSDNDDEDKIE